MMLIEHSLNALQYGALLFLLSAGLTLVFGTMNVINLAHGSLYMVGAFCAAAGLLRTGSFAVAVLAALVGAGLYGVVLERLVLRRLYMRDHLEQVLATLGVTLFTNELVTLVFGRRPPNVDTPAMLAGSVEILPDLHFPVMRLAFIAVGLAVALGLWWLIQRTRVGMLVRAGADDREMVQALGANIGTLYTVIFVVGAMLCGLAGVMSAPLLAVEIGMGERMLITAFVVVVIGGVGSVAGALLGALLVGAVDVFGRAYLPAWIGLLLPPTIADPVGSGLVSMSIYVLMAALLLFRPQGLMGQK